MAEEEFEEKELALPMVTEHTPPTFRAMIQAPRPPVPTPFLHEEPALTPRSLYQDSTAVEETTFVPIPKQSKKMIQQATLRLRQFPLVRVLRRCTSPHRKPAFTTDPSQLDETPVTKDEVQDYKPNN